MDLRPDQQARNGGGITGGSGWGKIGPAPDTMGAADLEKQLRLIIYIVTADLVPLVVAVVVAAVATVVLYSIFGGTPR